MRAAAKIINLLESIFIAISLYIVPNLLVWRGLIFSKFVISIYNETSNYVSKCCVWRGPILHFRKLVLVMCQAHIFSTDKVFYLMSYHRVINRLQSWESFWADHFKFYTILTYIEFKFFFLIMTILRQIFIFQAISAFEWLLFLIIFSFSILH